jgi:hypothetical protein
LGVNAPSGFAGNLLDLQVNGTSKFRVDRLGHAYTNDMYAAAYFGTFGKSIFNSPSDGVMLVTNYAVTDFNRLQFGGTSASFPALKRSTTTLQARLADDSGYTTIDAQLRAQGTAPAATGSTGTAGDIRYDADYIYICTATNTWKRAALSTW